MNGLRGLGMLRFDLNVRMLEATEMARGYYPLHVLIYIVFCFITDCKSGGMKIVNIDGHEGEKYL